jgi:hypothetical protein
VRSAKGDGRTAMDDLVLTCVYCAYCMHICAHSECVCTHIGHGGNQGYPSADASRDVASTGIIVYSTSALDHRERGVRAEDERVGLRECSGCGETWRVPVSVPCVSSFLYLSLFALSLCFCLGACLFHSFSLSLPKPEQHRSTAQIIRRRRCGRRSWSGRGRRDT